MVRRRCLGLSGRRLQSELVDLSSYIDVPRFQGDVGSQRGCCAFCVENVTLLMPSYLRLLHLSIFLRLVAVDVLNLCVVALNVIGCQEKRERR